MDPSLPYRHSSGQTLEATQETPSRTVTKMAMPPSPASPPFSSQATHFAKSQLKAGQHDSEFLAPTQHALPTPPITPVKPALARGANSRVASIDLERDTSLPSEPRLFSETLQMGSLLGDGQWARVFYARSHSEDGVTGVQVYAVKVPRPSKNGQPASVLRHEACVLTFLSSQVGSMEHIVPFYGLEASSQGLMLGYAPSTLESLVKEYPAGSPLQRDPIVGTLPFLSLARSLVSSLEWIHERGFIHGDIKPRNILAWSLEDVRLADFSSARLVSDTDPRVGDTCTAAYAAPELLKSFRNSSGSRGIPSKNSDIWGLAATLLFAGTNEEPYSNIQHALGRLGEAQRGTLWMHMRNGSNIGRVRQDGILYKVLSGILLKEEGERWRVREWLATIEESAREVEAGV